MGRNQHTANTGRLAMTLMHWNPAVAITSKASHRIRPLVTVTARRLWLATRRCQWWRGDGTPTLEAYTDGSTSLQCFHNYNACLAGSPYEISRWCSAKLLFPTGAKFFLLK